MAVSFEDEARDQRVLRSFAHPLPRLTPRFEPRAQTEGGINGDHMEKYEVVIAGAGPAGMMLELLLARYGLPDTSLLCIDPKSATLKCGQADGLQPRTLEVLQSLGMAHEILTEGCQMWEIAFWNPTVDPESIARGRLIERTSIVPDIAIATRFPHEVTIHQGRIERIFEDDLARYSKRGVQRATALVDVKVDDTDDAEFPVVATLERDGIQWKIRTKYLVGADGAHSVVRARTGLHLEGDWTDHIWGVVDLVVDSDFPDLRRRTAIHSPAGSAMIIPRERVQSGEYLTRLYVQIQDEVEPDVNPGNDTSCAATSDARDRKAKVTLDSILSQVQTVLKPYYLQPKFDGAVDWWTAYQIGQRVAERFIVKDGKEMPRVFIVGDACHTHSPKAGQGMNVSMMDSYNLAWKLAYSINGLTPAAAAGKPDDILNTYHQERHTVAQQLIEFDKAFSSKFSGKIGAAEENGTRGLSHEQFLEVFNTGNGFTSGCGIEYPENSLVQREYASSMVKRTDYLAGILRPGRRLLSARVKRHADGCPRELQDDFLSTGRFRILVLTSTDLLSPDGVSVTTITTIASTLLNNEFPPTILELVAIHPRLSRSFDWRDLPFELKKHAEMRFYDGNALQDVYETFGVPVDQGIIAVVRPDGYVGTLAALGDVERVETYLSTCLRRM